LSPGSDQEFVRFLVVGTFEKAGFGQGALEVVVELMAWRLVAPVPLALPLYP